jgi:endogenous inhibitor of DNA gyrase (YacG/DUF329 family)
VKCPICQTEIAWKNNPHRPFCSERCRLIDLGAWAEGKYRIPGRKVEDEGQKEKDEDGEEPS